MLSKIKKKALNKLKLKQRLSETLAEEAVYEKALKDEGHLFELEQKLPHETERMIDGFMTQSELSTRPLSLTAGLVSAVNFDTGIPAAPKSGTGLPAASYPDTGIPFALYPGTGIPAAYSPGTELPTASYPDTGLPFAPDTSKGIPADCNPDTEFPAVSMPFSATSSTDTGIPITSNLETGYATASQFPALSAVSGNLNTSKLFVSHTTNSPTAPRLSTKRCTPVTASELACGTIKPVASFPQKPLHTSLSWATSHHSPGAIRSMNPDYPSVYDQRPEADIFTPKASPGTVYHEFRPSPFPVSLNLPQTSTVSVNQIAEALAKVTWLQRLPQAKPSVFRGDGVDPKFFIWETVFDALIDSAPISAQQKLYPLYQHLDEKAKKVVEQLQYMVGANPEIAYNEARKKLKQRFGCSAIVATDFENKLANWPKIAYNDAQGLRDFSDFLQQVEIAKTHLPSLTIFE